MPKTFTNAAEMGRDPDFIKAWTTNPAIVAVLLEAEARYQARHEAKETA